MNSFRSHEEKTADFYRIMRGLDIVQKGHDFQLATAADVKYCLYVLSEFQKLAGDAWLKGIGKVDTGPTPAWSKYTMYHTELWIQKGASEKYTIMRERNSLRLKIPRYVFRVYPNGGAMRLPDKTRFLKCTGMERDSDGAEFVGYVCKDTDAAREYGESITLASVAAGL